MYILFRDFNAKVGREDVFKPTIGNESLHEINNDNGVKIVAFTTTTKSFKSTMFSHRNIHNNTWTSPEGKTHNQTDHVLRDKGLRSNIFHVRSFREADCDTDQLSDGCES
jgi:hypothetical protein